MKITTCILIAILAPVLLYAKEHTFESQGCAITIPDKGWEDVPLDNVPESQFLAVANINDHKLITLAALPMLPSVSDSVALATVEYNIRNGAFDKNAEVATLRRITVAGLPAYSMELKRDAVQPNHRLTVVIVANRRIYIILMVSEKTKPEQDAELQRILNSFRILGRTVEAPQIRSTKEGTIYTYKSARCTITIPDGWAEMQTPSQQSPGSALMARNAQGTHYLHLIIMKVPPGESDEMNDEGIDQMKRGMRDGNYGEYITELTDTTITMAGVPAIMISGSYSGGLVSSSETVWMLSNGYMYGITFYSKDVRPEDDTEIQAIINSFRLL